MKELVSGIAALAALAAMSRFFPGIEPLSPGDGFAGRALWLFVAGAGTLAIAARRLDPERFANLLFATTLPACLFLFGPRDGLVVLALPALWLLCAHFLPGLSARLLFAAAGLALLQFLRKRGIETLALWWAAGQWLRLLAVSFDWKGNAPLSARPVRDSVLHFCAPPFLLSPVPLEWITFGYFRECLSRKQAGPVPGAARLLWTGVVFLLLHDACRAWVEPFRSRSFEFERLSALDGEGFFHLQAGWTFFLLRLWQYCGLTGLAAGAWQLMGIPVRYDFDRPLLSRNGLEFWRRYHNYGREFLLKNIFYPCAFVLSRRLPWGASAALSAVAVFAMIVVVQATSIVPIANVPLSATYSWEGAFHHTLWSAVMILLTSLFSFAVARLRLPGRLAAGIEIAFTLLLLGWLFFNSFSQLWLNRGHAEFLRAVLSW